ncbi:MAG: hypothetical protein H0X73_09625 [Chthoniobacterales bacterium]|nr:hypothetical protein [Chthoniobacterales bacterium]
MRIRFCRSSALARRRRFWRQVEENLPADSRAEEADKLDVKKVDGFAYTFAIRRINGITFAFSQSKGFSHRFAKGHQHGQAEGINDA